ncbi:MAG: FkbM family methyltransferase [Fischerella sp.]|nr:FkbM family methyltransferase [Fischerella sp.]
MENLFAQVPSINFLDIGCSGSLDDKWSDLFPLLCYTGFDPNAEECQRLNQQTHPYKSARYLPYAIAGEKGKNTLYMTESIYCYSLLRPNQTWIKRFSFADLFKETGIDSVECTTLNHLAEEQELRADIIKIDTQGLELPIFQAGDKVLADTFCVETETGFVQNYFGETTYAQIDEFMRSKGFLMFDINVHRVSRKNLLSEYGKQQPIWCEAVWLFDFIGQDKKPTYEQSIKSLMICKALNYCDYGLELATYFHSLGLIDSELMSHLEKPENWLKPKRKPALKSGKLLNLLPENINRRLLFGMREILDINNILEKFC